MIRFKRIQKKLIYVALLAPLIYLSLKQIAQELGPRYQVAKDLETKEPPEKLETSYSSKKTGLLHDLYKNINSNFQEDKGLNKKKPDLENVAINNTEDESPFENQIDMEIDAEDVSQSASTPARQNESERDIESEAENRLDEANADARAESALSAIHNSSKPFVGRNIAEITPNKISNSNLVMSFKGKEILRTSDNRIRVGAPEFSKLQPKIEEFLNSGTLQSVILFARKNTDKRKITVLTAFFERQYGWTTQVHQIESDLQNDSETQDNLEIHITLTQRSGASHGL